jgi:hypothetical protein
VSVTNGQLANQTVFNDAFVSRTAAQSIAGGKQFSGYVAMTRADVATASTITAMSSSTSFVKLTGSTVTEIQGVTAGINGQTLSIYNGSTAIVSFAHENGSASAANRIDLPENRSFYLYPDCTAKLVYESALSRWVLASAGPVFGNVAFQRSFKFSSTADNATGSAVTLTAATTPLVSLTNASLASVGGVPAGEAGQVVYIINNTGVSVSILDEDGSTTAANRIRTGTGASVTVQDHGTIILLYDSSASRWNMIGGSSGGGGGGEGLTNFVSASDGSSLTGWSTYADAAATSPVDGTGGSPASTLASSTDSSLVGAENFLWTKSAANRQGEGFSYAFSIDEGYRSKPITVSFMYKIASGTYADDDMSVWIYDVTNAVLIQPSSYQIKNAVGTTIQKCEFQAASNSTSYRLIVHTSSTSASAYTVRFDSFSVSPNTYNSGAVVTEPVAYTPTFTGFGTVSVQNFKSWRSGKYLFVDGTFTCGTVTATEARITLGYNGKNANVTTVSTLPTLSQVGAFSINVNGANAFTVLTEASKNYLTLGNGYVSGASLAKGNGNIVGGTGAIISLFGRFEIEGWGTSQVLSSDTDTRVVGASVYNLSGASYSYTTDTPLTFDGKRYDTHGAFNISTYRYTVPVSGKYQCSLNYAKRSSGSGNDAYLAKNGSLVESLLNLDTIAKGGFVIVECVAGDVLDFRMNLTATVTATSATFTRISGPSQIAASEKIRVQYTGNAGAANTADVTDVDFVTKVVDSHGAWSGTTFTAPRADWYDFKAMIFCTTSASRSFSLFVGGSKRYYMFSVPAAGTSMHGPGTTGIYLLAGETATIRLDTNGTLSNNAVNHWVAITSQG